MLHDVALFWSPSWTPKLVVWSTGGRNRRGQVGLCILSKACRSWQEIDVCRVLYWVEEIGDCNCWALIDYWYTWSKPVTVATLSMSSREHTIKSLRPQILLKCKTNVYWYSKQKMSDHCCVIPSPMLHLSTAIACLTRRKCMCSLMKNMLSTVVMIVQTVLLKPIQHRPPTLVNLEYGMLQTLDSSLTLRTIVDTTSLYITKYFVHDFVHMTTLTWTCSLLSAAANLRIWKKHKEIIWQVDRISWNEFGKAEHVFLRKFAILETMWGLRPQAFLGKSGSGRSTQRPCLAPCCCHSVENYGRNWTLELWCCCDDHRATKQSTTLYKDIWQ